MFFFYKVNNYINYTIHPISHMRFLFFFVELYPFNLSHRISVLISHMEILFINVVAMLVYTNTATWLLEENYYYFLKKKTYVKRVKKKAKSHN